MGFLKLVFNTVGIYSEFSHDKLRQIVTKTAVTIPLLITMLTSVAYTIMNKTDVTKATDGFYLVIGYAMASGMYWSLIAEQWKMGHLLNQLNQLVQMRKNLNLIFDFNSLIEWLIRIEKMESSLTSISPCRNQR